MRNLSMKKFGTPSGAAPGVAIDSVGLSRVGVPPGARPREPRPLRPRLSGSSPSAASSPGPRPYSLPLRCFLRPVVFCFLRFPSGLSAHLHLSWLDPHKERRFTVVGAKRMATFDDMALEGKVTVYDKGFDEDTSSYGEYITRSGDIHSPRIPNREPLRIECEHFVECVRTGTPPRSDGRSGLRVVRVLEALQNSLDETTRSARAAL